VPDPEVILDIFEGDAPIGDRHAWPVSNHFHARIVPVGSSPGSGPDYEISTTGVWVDLATGDVVAAQPSEGRQLCAPGGPLTLAVLAAIEGAGG
jgi:hypothetical protein